MSRRFQNLTYGPFHLRPTLRERLLPGERLIGWASVQEVTPVADAALFFCRSATVLLPGLWQLVGAVVPVLFNVRNWAAVLTDRRLLLLDADRQALDTGLGGIVADLRLSSLEVDTRETLAIRPAFQPAGAATPDARILFDENSGRDLTDCDTFRLAAPAQPPFWIRIPGGARGKGAAGRLREALTLLALDADPAEFRPRRR